MTQVRPWMMLAAAAVAAAVGAYWGVAVLLWMVSNYETADFASWILLSLIAFMAPILLLWLAPRLYAGGRALLAPQAAGRKYAAGLGPSRRFSRILSTTALVVLLVVSLVLSAVIQVRFDMQTRDYASSGVAAASAVSDRLLAYRVDQGRWPADAGKLVAGSAPVAHVQDITVVSDGVVRVRFKDRVGIHGKAAEIETRQQDGKFIRTCRAPDIRDSFLPAACRSNQKGYAVDPGQQAQPAR